MNFSGIGKMLSKQKEREKESEALKTEAGGFQLATDGGYIVVLKYALFTLFGFYNVRLFLTTVPGWERYLTAVFALLGEATALYCFNKYTRSTGRHKQALGPFALLLFAFSFTHATISFFVWSAATTPDRSTSTVSTSPFLSCSACSCWRQS